MRMTRSIYNVRQADLLKHPTKKCFYEYKSWN